MDKFLARIDGYKTYIGLAIGAAGVLCPALGAPVLACHIVASAGAILSLVGAAHKDAKIADALGQGAELAKQLEALKGTANER